MSCSLTLQKFLPGGLRVLSDSAWNDFGSETKSIEAQMAVWIQPARHKSFGSRAPLLTTARQQRLCIFCYTLLVNS